MKVLGISPLDKDATVSLVEDGRVLFACGEERLSRVKLQDGFPHRALQLGLQRTGWQASQIDKVAYGFFDADTELRLIQAGIERDRKANGPRSTADSIATLAKALASNYQLDAIEPIPGLAEEFMPRKSALKRLVYRWASRWAWCDWRVHRRFLRQWRDAAFADHRLRTRQITEGLAQYGLLDKLKRVQHHDTHAFGAFYSSGFEDALVICLDAYGSGNAGAVYRAQRGDIRLLHRFSFPNSLGIFYEFVTSALGFRAGRHEGKIVGLAAYGDPEILGPVLRQRFDCRDGELVMRGAMNYYFTRYLAQHFAKRDVAAAYQRVLEEVVADTAAWWVEKTGARNVAVAGGVHANVKLNQRIQEISGVEQVFVYPNMGDGGCATGAALMVSDPEELPREPIENVYYGPDYSEAAMKAALENADLPFERSKEPEREIARLLSENRIVARFNGRMEYGPRALGNRSILYPAQDPQVNLWLNHQLGRTEFMPFAPAAMADQAHRLFHNVEGCEKTAEFMTITFDCTDEMVHSCPAAVHVDRTARPQLVSERTNDSFYQVLRHYHERTGVSAVINTSFNMHEEPIVCSPEDAVRAFLQGRLDYLALGPFIVPHPRLASIEQERGDGRKLAVQAAE